MNESRNLSLRKRRRTTFTMIMVQHERLETTIQYTTVDCDIVILSQKMKLLATIRDS